MRCCIPFSYFGQILHSVERSGTTHEHPLALLAEETKKHLKKDAHTFMPILSQRHPQATVVSASLIHKLYGNKLVSSDFIDWHMAFMYSPFFGFLYTWNIWKKGA